MGEKFTLEFKMNAIEMYLLKGMGRKRRCYYNYKRFQKKISSLSPVEYRTKAA
ncbi:IS3 family transposase [Planococcus sp. ISL-109]|uniref:IS3 family transposase n=1 Tax=Planococcus sp. ISL-109 TaxID=2819166 RepID=UPI003335D158